MAEMLFNENFILSVLPEAKFLGANLSICQDVSVKIDSRFCEKGDIFVALTGSKVNGHDFIQEAIDKGAIGLVINVDQKTRLDKIDAQLLKNIFVVLVKDTRISLVKLAVAWRNLFSYPVVGITGSVGKTTTKEILANIVKAEGLPFIASLGNQNTELGVAINVFRMRSTHKVAIFEVGINKQGEMAKIAYIIKPTIALITTIGHSHMEGLGSLNDIMQEKRKIFEYFKNDNIGVICGDLALLANYAYKHPIVKFGCKGINQVQARKVQLYNSSANFILKLYQSRINISLDTNHEGRILNSLAAATLAYLLNISQASIVTGIQTYKTMPGRFEYKTLKDNKGILIDDCYNANPESMKASLLAFEKVECRGQKIAVIGDMLELGVNGQFWHRQIGRFLRKVPSLDHIILVGDMVKSVKPTLPIGLSYEFVDTCDNAIDALNKRLDSEAAVLVKASNGVKLNKLVKEVAF